MFAILIASILLVKIIFSLGASLPTDAYTRAGDWLKARFLRSREKDLTRALTDSSPFFHQDKSFLKRGVGLAVDDTAKQVFIATRETGRLQSIILPFSALLGQSSGEVRSVGFYDYYVDIEVNSGPRPLWRLLCGENEELARELNQTVAAIRG
jgi:hypothetical protein